MTDNRIGIMGGTFDPIHVGHLAIAEAVREEFSLRQVLFIPANIPPHKQGRRIVPADKRLAMVKLATADNAAFTVLDIELKRNGPSYTVDTLDELRRNAPPTDEFYFITGTDAADELATWYKPTEILAKCHIVVTSRPGVEFDPDKLAGDLGTGVYEKVHRLTTPRLEISSTDIRRRLAAGRSVRYLLPEAVRKFIYQEGLYQ